LSDWTEAGGPYYGERARGAGGSYYPEDGAAGPDAGGSYYGEAEAGGHGGGSYYDEPDTGEHDFYETGDGQATYYENDGGEAGYDQPDSGDQGRARRRGAGVLPPGYVDHERPPGGPPPGGPPPGVLPPGYADHEVSPGGPPDGPPGGRRTHRRERRRHPVLWTVAVLVVLLVLVVGGGLIWVQHQINPGGHPGPAVAVSIPKGASTRQIGKILAHDGVIHEATVFAYYVRFHGDGPFYPGLYHLHRNSSYQTAISALEAGPPIVTDRLVIPEGFTARDIARSVGELPGMGLSAQKFLAAADDGTVRSPYEPAGVNNLEGLLFPATYQVQQGETEVQILEQMVGAFDDRASSLGLAAAAHSRHETVYQLVTVASIVEREAKLDSDRGPVASVLYNRLAAGMPLGADSTETYYLRLSDPTLEPTPSQLNQPGPYNTRLNTGLPPTPIANAGQPSLQAAANPPTTSYMYFVEIAPDGQLGFASTSSGFAQLQAQCRAANLC
jgi:UPF0755 protein